MNLKTPSDPKIKRRLGEKIEEKIKEYHQFLRTPPKGEHFEDLVSQALIETGHASHGWFDGDHAQGTDIWDSPFGSLSLKTNKLYGKNVIRADMSSHRLTSFGTDLDAMLDHIKSKKSDFYLLCTRRTDRGKEYRIREKQGGGYEEYEIFLIPANFLCVRSYDWHEYDGGWKANVSPGFTLSIVKSMSNQFWMRGIPYQRIKPYSFRRIQVNHRDMPHKMLEIRGADPDRT